MLILETVKSVQKGLLATKDPSEKKNAILCLLAPYKTTLVITVNVYLVIEKDHINGTNPNFATLKPGYNYLSQKKLYSVLSATQDTIMRSIERPGNPNECHVPMERTWRNQVPDRRNRNALLARRVITRPRYCTTRNGMT